MVVARGNVGDDGAQHVEGRPHADALLHLHVGLDLVQGHVAGALHHHLHVPGPGPAGQLAQAYQFLDLAHVAGVGQAAGTAGISQGDGHVVLPADVQDLIKILVEGVLLPRHAHPGKDQGAAPGDNVHLPLVGFDLVDGLAGDAAVECDEVHAVLGMEADHVDEVPGRQGSQVPLVVDDAVIDGHGTDHGGTLPGQLLPEGLGIAVGGQVHDGLRPHMDSGHDLLHLHIVVLAVPGHPQVHVDLGAQHGAHTVGVQAGVEPVGADGHLTPGHQVPDLLLGTVLLGGHRLHFGGDDPLSGCFHLCGILSHGDSSFQTDCFSSAKVPLKAKLWAMGPLPFPRSSMAARAPEMYALAL